MDDRSLSFETLAAQAGLHMRVAGTTSTVPAIDPSTTFTYDSIGDVHAALQPDGEGYAYSRNANPTVVAFEQAMRPLHEAEEVVAFGSGMAAVHAALLGAGLEAGETIVAASDLYGVTRGLLGQLAGFDVRTRFVDILQLDALQKALDETGSRLLFYESISNPLLRVPDVEAIGRLCGERRIVSIVDNTFATPYLLRPLRLGATMEVHSATKYIAGHGDVTAGLVATNRSFAKRVRDIRSTGGGVLSPFEAWLALRGVRTLPIRMDRQSASALELARRLGARPWVERVYYPGLQDHPQHAAAARLLGDKFGGMLAFDLRADGETTLRFLDALRLITAGTSLGDVQSLVLYPRLSSHRSLLPEELRRVGIGEGLVRLSVGLEDPDDLMRDLEGAAVAAGLTVDRKTAGAAQGL
ncbi:MAG: aminotransferase class I/II-fold pyridoxal phosphate-dependent enzyme [Chloroflexi bacterium]|nr:aminotransferase class I/II-fold pyridoxal phosphate-dependent enzyme [Chloroflexota bacterium]